LKMYHRAREPFGRTIYDVFPPEVLEEAQALCVPIVLHLPVPAPVGLGQLERLVRDFPRLQIVLAHLGVIETPVPKMDETYRQIAEWPNVFMDTALITDTRVVRAAIEALGIGRIIFGSDEPLSLIRAMPVIAADGTPRLATDH